MVARTVSSLLCCVSLAIVTHAQRCPTDEPRAAVRVVPQLSWATYGESRVEGLHSHDDRYAAAIVGNTVRIVDLEHARLTQLLVLGQRVTAVAFSPEDRFLAACCEGGGKLLDRHTGAARKLDTLCGAAVALSADNQRIFVASVDSAGRPGERALRILAIDGRVLRRFELEMMVPRTITPEQDRVTVTGISGRLWSRMRPDSVDRVTQRIDLVTGVSTTDVEKGKPDGNWRRFPALASAPKPEGKYGEFFTDLFLDESTGIAVIRGRGMPEGRVLKVWDIRRGALLFTLGTGNNVKDAVGFIEPGKFAAQTWYRFEPADPDGLLTSPAVGPPTTFAVPTVFDLRHRTHYPVPDTAETLTPYAGNRHIHERHAQRALEPIPLAGGKLGLMPEGMTLRLHLVRLSDREVLLTFAAFEDDAWIIHSPDGVWTGSDRVLRHVCFYRGLELLPASEIKGLRNPKRIAELLKAFE